MSAQEILELWIWATHERYRTKDSTARSMWATVTYYLEAARYQASYGLIHTADAFLEQADKALEKLQFYLDAHQTYQDFRVY